MRNLATGNLPFAQLKEQAHINRRSAGGERCLRFLRRIREGRAGF
jgi:hypothetical protein